MHYAANKIPSDGALARGVAFPPAHSSTTHIPVIDRSPDHPGGAMRPSYLNVFFGTPFALFVPAVGAARFLELELSSWGRWGLAGGPQQSGEKAFPVGPC